MSRTRDRHFIRAVRATPAVVARTRTHVSAGRASGSSSEVRGENRPRVLVRLRRRSGRRFRRHHGCRLATGARRTLAPHRQKPRTSCTAGQVAARPTVGDKRRPSRSVRVEGGLRATHSAPLSARLGRGVGRTRVPHAAARSSARPAPPHSAERGKHEIGGLVLPDEHDQSRRTPHRHARRRGSGSSPPANVVHQFTSWTMLRLTRVSSKFPVSQQSCQIRFS